MCGVIRSKDLLNGLSQWLCARNRDFKSLFYNDLYRAVPIPLVKGDGPHNPKVTGSNPVPATNKIKHLAQPHPLGFLLSDVHVGTV
ncbi:protein of unknown function [Thiomonas sp. CB2]|nr:protein of unknown function [Thiomonas sp. CB2]